MRPGAIALYGFNPLYTGHQRPEGPELVLWKEVSIPYTRVTNPVPDDRYLDFEPCFNPLYTGHQPEAFPTSLWAQDSFNPLYTGHQLPKPFQHHYGHKTVSIPYTRVTNKTMIPSEPTNTTFQSPIHGSPTYVFYCFWFSLSIVSIPYTRVTNFINPKIAHTLSVFQSPIHGSPTRVE